MWGRWRGITVINPSNPLNRARSRRAILEPADAPAPLLAVVEQVPSPWEVVSLTGKLTESYIPASRVNPINHSNTRDLGTHPVQPRGNATQPPFHFAGTKPGAQSNEKAGGAGCRWEWGAGTGGRALIKIRAPINPRVSPFYFYFSGSRSLVPVPRRNRSGTWTYRR